MARLRITRLVPVLDFGGVETGLLVQADHTDRERFELRVCTFWKDGRAASALRERGVPVDVLGPDPAVRNPRASLALARYLRRTRPDVLHATVPEADFHAALVGRVAGAGAVIVDEAGMPSRRGVARMVFSGLHQRADGIIGVSQALCEHLIAREHAPRDRVHLVYYCGAPAYFRDPKSDWTVEDRPFRLVVVGRQVEVKNQLTLIRAFEGMPPGIELALVGDGPLRGDIDAEIARLGLGDRVKRLGFVDDLPGFLRTRDAYAIPSHSEGCSLSLIEAMASGVPPIASDVPGNREVMGALGDAWRVPPTDVAGWRAAVTRMAALSAEQRADLGRRAIAIAGERFSPQVYTRALERVYEHVVAGRLQV